MGVAVVNAADVARHGRAPDEAIGLTGARVAAIAGRKMVPDVVALAAVLAATV
jgi:hypothetical protein